MMNDLGKEYKAINFKMIEKTKPHRLGMKRRRENM